MKDPNVAANAVFPCRACFFGVLTLKHLFPPPPPHFESFPINTLNKPYFSSRLAFLSAQNAPECPKFFDNSAKNTYIGPYTEPPFRDGGLKRKSKKTAEKKFFDSLIDMILITGFIAAGDASNPNIPDLAGGVRQSSVIHRKKRPYGRLYKAGGRGFTRSRNTHNKQP
jgi:hypothetical protein